jgi:hypothetical protein
MSEGQLPAEYVAAVEAVAEAAEQLEDARRQAQWADDEHLRLVTVKRRAEERFDDALRKFREISASKRNK